MRELENTIERAVLVADGDVIHGHHLSPTLQTAEASGTVVSGSLGEAVAAFESNLIQDALKTTRGNRARAARLLSTTERIINYKIRRYGIDPRRFRTDEFVAVAGSLGRRCARHSRAKSRSPNVLRRRPGGAAASGTALVIRGCGWCYRRATARRPNRRPAAPACTAYSIGGTTCFRDGYSDC